LAYDGTIKFDTSIDTNGFQKDANRIGDIFKGLGIFKIVEEGFRMITDSVDTAISRYDTLNRFPRVLEQMGFSADDASAATKKLSDGVQGLPTALDDVVSTAQRITVLTGNLDEATDTTLALNNAFLASGSSAEDASRGLTQYVQMLSTGKVDMMSWRTLQETMGVALQTVAESFGFAGEAAQSELYAALRDGNITFKEFNGKLVELDKGVGGFADRAKTATGGIGTAFANLKTRTAAGVTEIIAALDRGFAQTRFKSIENVINTVGNSIKKTLSDLAGVFEFVARNSEFLIAAFKGIATGLSAFKILSVINGLWQSYLAIKAVLIGHEAAHRLMLLATNGALAAKELLVGVLIGKIPILTAVTAAWNAVVAANPLILLAIAIGAVVAAIALFGTSVDDAKYKTTEYSDAASELQQSTDDLADSTAQAEIEHKKNLEAINQSANEARLLTTQLEELRGKTELTAAEQEKMNSATQTLIEKYPQLNALIDEQTGQLTGNKSEWDAVIQSQQEYAKAVVMLERNVELTQNLAEAQINLSVASEMYATNQDKIARKTAELTYLEQQQAKAKLKMSDSTGKTADAIQRAGREYGRYSESIKRAEGELSDLNAAQKTLEETIPGLTEAEKELIAQQEAQANVTRLLAQAALDSYASRIDGVNLFKEVNTQITDQEIAEIRALIDAGAELTDAQLARFEEIEGLRSAELVAEQDYVQEIKDGLHEINEAEAERIEQKRVNGEELTEIEKAYLDKWKETNKEAVEHYKGQQKEIVDAAKSTKKAIVLSEQQSAEERLEIQAANNKATAQYVSNYNSIWGKIPESHKQYLSDMTIEDARFLQEVESTWNEGGKEQWEQYVDGIKTGVETSEQLVQGTSKELGENMGDATKEGIESKKGDLEAATTDNIEAVEKAGKDQVNKSNFIGIGIDIANGLALGISSGKYKVMSAMSGLVNAAYIAGRRAAESSSPARKFMPLGEDMDAGVAVGMKARKLTQEAASDLMQDAYKAAAMQQSAAARTSSITNIYNTAAAASAPVTKTNSTSYTYNSPKALGMREIRQQQILADQRQRLGVSYG
jgi:tape measure domain-containing protein